MIDNLRVWIEGKRFPVDYTKEQIIRIMLSVKTRMKL